MFLIPQKRKNTPGKSKRQSMKILSLDTASQSCSVAIVADNIVLAELTVNHGRTHAEVLMGMIQRAIEMGNLSISDVDGFAATIGPGSFTGLRIGLSTVKGLAVATKKPVVGVSTLEALAYVFSFSQKLVCPMMDARKGEVYTAGYRFCENKMITVFKPRVIPPDLVVKNIKEPCILTGDGAVKYRDVFLDKIGSYTAVASPALNLIRASTVARLSMLRFEKNDIDDVGSLIPYYIRKSDAEKNIKSSA